MVLALLGDNPMQSEFACHIGLRGKFFCRACWVKGHDALNPSENKGKTSAADSDDGAASMTGSEVGAGSHAGSDGAETSAAGSQAGSEASSSPKKGKRGAKKAKETLAELVRRAKDFIKVRLQDIYAFFRCA